MKSNLHKLRYLFSEMPVMDHFQGEYSPDGLHIEDSEILQWISKHTEALCFLFDLALQEDAIRFDPTSRKWYGRRIPVAGNGESGSKKRGRPLKATFQDVMDQLPYRPVTVTEWGDICHRKLGISRPTFAVHKKRAVSEGLVTVQCKKQYVICTRTPEKTTNQNSSAVSPVIEPDSGTVATAVTIQK